MRWGVCRMSGRQGGKLKPLKQPKKQPREEDDEVRRVCWGAAVDAAGPRVQGEAEGGGCCLSLIHI